MAVNPGTPSWPPKKGNQIKKVSLPGCKGKVCPLLGQCEASGGAYRYRSSGRFFPLAFPERPLLWSPRFERIGNSTEMNMPQAPWPVSDEEEDLPDHAVAAWQKRMREKAGVLHKWAARKKPPAFPVSRSSKPRAAGDASALRPGAPG